MTNLNSLQYVKCNFCDKSNYKVIAKFKSNDLISINKCLLKEEKSPLGPAKTEFRVVRCLKCGLQYINPRLSDKQLLRFYEGFYAKEFHGENIAFENSVYNTLNTEQEIGRLNDIERFKKRGKILDIGAGPGHFLKIAKEKGWQVYGQELSSQARAIARQQFGINIFAGKIEKLPYPDNFFDCITMHSTIEHTENPMQYITNAFKKLKPGGLLVFSAPNIRSSNFYLAKILKLPYPGFIFEHLYYFNPRVLKMMLGNKFEILDITSYHHSKPQYPQITNIKIQPQNKYLVFLKMLYKEKHKAYYIRQRFYFFQMRILREFLEYTRFYGRLKLGDVLYVFARKKSHKLS